MAWFYLAVLATLLYAIVTLLDDNLLAFVYKSPYVACVSVGFFGSLPLLSRFVLHAGGIPANLAVLSALAGFLTLGYYFFYFKGLQSDTPSVVIALFTLAPATIPFLAYFFVGERLNGLQIIGFAVVLAASLALAVQDLRHFKFSRALLYVGVGVMMLDALSIITKYVYERVDFYPAYLFFSLGMGLGGVFFYLIRLRDNSKAIATIARKIKRLLPLFVIAEATGLSAELTLNLAISHGPVSLVKVVEGSQAMFVLVIALLLYPLAPQYFREAKEGFRLPKLALMLIAVVGLATISLA
jgi:drug/metabolite transporter (DMT)-like permease